MNGPLTPAHGFYAFIALAAVLAIGWIVGRMIFFREETAEDPIEREYRDIL